MGCSSVSPASRPPAHTRTNTRGVYLYTVAVTLRISFPTRHVSVHVLSVITWGPDLGLAWECSLGEQPQDRRWGHGGQRPVRVPPTQASRFQTRVPDLVPWLCCACIGQRVGPRGTGRPRPHRGGGGRGRASPGDPSRVQSVHLENCDCAGWEVLSVPQEGSLLRCVGLRVTSRPAALSCPPPPGIDYKTTTILLDGRRVKLQLW